MSNDTSEELTRKTRFTLAVALSVIVALALMYLLWFWLINGLTLAKENPSAWSDFADFVGGVAGPVVALFALYWLTESIKVQRQELADTRSILSAQSDIDKKRNFETTFFSLLQHLNSMHVQLKERQADESSDLSYLHGRVFMHNSTEDANEALEDNNDMCSHYFISLFQTLKFVASHFQDDLRDADQLGTRLQRTSSSSEEKFYSNIVRASLDNKTTQLLAINCFSSSQTSYWLFKILVERYALLEHMPFSVRSTTNYHSGLVHCWTDFYESRAFGKSDYVAKLRQLGYAP